ncbi:MAG: hypothetical protein IJX30_00115 [Clostridia bacterium]|nr:hypothetical protein [Clostridia bacterium]
MARSRERFINYGLILLTIAFVAFALLYDYQRINAYGETLEESGQKAGYALGAMLIYIFFNICILGGGSAAIAIALFVSTKILSKPNGKSKKSTVITILVFKIIGCALTVFGVYLAFSLAHADWIMKVVYTLTAAAYLAATAHSIICFKKIVQ